MFGRKVTVRRRWKVHEALLIIDVQNDYFPGGACELYHAYEAEKKIQQIISESREQGRPIIYIQHINRQMIHFSLRRLMDARFQNVLNHYRMTR